MAFFQIVLPEPPRPTEIETTWDDAPGLRCQSKRLPRQHTATAKFDVRPHPTMPWSERNDKCVITLLSAFSLCNPNEISGMITLFDLSGSGGKTSKRKRSSP
ncbi:hypothetical protein CHS0354_005161 [Potamilus streckersoni]|uniref:Uncharacterized protein n=1 Tax=Potamilus streckersoni TaxID=2493646 RepID=A0AAE0RVL7_9BIVA|nr:hypothetical protein CHS0354_005161 [Potamilus streckersoni]